MRSKSTIFFFFLPPLPNDIDDGGRWRYPVVNVPLIRDTCTTLSRSILMAHESRAN